jgi:hypothetical protein
VNIIVGHLWADAEACVSPFAEEFGFPCAMVVVGDLDDAVHVGGFLDAGLKQDADVVAADEAVEVSPFRR